MKSNNVTRFPILAIGFPILATLSAQQARKRPIDYVNTLMGTAPMDNQTVIGNAPPPGEALYTGFTMPGATLPHSHTALQPKNTDWDLTYEAGQVASYYYLRRTMIGFTTAMPDVTIMPVVGAWTPPPQRPASVYDKAKEKGTPGYYTVDLDDFGVKVEMTATYRTGMHRFTFPASTQSHVLLDIGRIGGSVEVVDDRTIRGCGDSTDYWIKQGTPSASAFRRGSNMRCFVAVFSKPFGSFGTFRPDRERRVPTLFGFKVVTPRGRSESGSYAGVYVDFTTKAGERILIKTAAAETDTAALQVIAAENPGWDFDAVKRQAEAAWSAKLDLIEVKGGTEHERRLFYSTLYHALSWPSLLARKGEVYAGQHGALTKAGYDRYGTVGFWDVARSQLVLLTLLEPQVKTDIMQSTLDYAKETGYVNVGFHGDHAILMYLGDWLRGVPFDYAAAYPYLRKNAMDPAGPRRLLRQYLDSGWVPDIVPPPPISPSPPNPAGNAGVAKTLEYSWDDYALSVYAERLGKMDDAAMFRKRASNYRNVFDASGGFMRGKTADGRWIAPFDPQEPYYNFMYKEASGWSMLWGVPHDVQGLITLLGGRDRFNAKLDTFFATPYTAKGICRDCTGMIGQYVQGNEPDQQVPYYYDWSGQPWKTQALVREILQRTYGSDKYGLSLPGNDDDGQTSSWYVLSAMGFFPVNPASAEYAIGSPLFDEVTLHMSNGKTFVIVAKHNSAQNVYIQSATLNGRPLTKPWFSHGDIANGGMLELIMGPKPNRRWGSAPEAAPASMSPR